MGLFFFFVLTFLVSMCMMGTAASNLSVPAEVCQSHSEKILLLQPADYYCTSKWVSFVLLNRRNPWGIPEVRIYLIKNLNSDV